jgi:hypothetical protein
MNKQTIYIIVGLIVFYGVIYFSGQERKNRLKHPTLSSLASEPDNYLQDVEYYEMKQRHTLSALNLEKAIQSIWRLERDVDVGSFEKLQSAIKRLEVVHESIVRDAVDPLELRAAIEYTLNNLAHAELEIAEMYAETNHMNEANIALKYAQLHIKNAMLFHDSFWMNDEEQLAIEEQVFEEMDSLMNNTTASPIEYTLTLDKMIKEVDYIIESQKQKK